MNKNNRFSLGNIFHDAEDRRLIRIGVPTFNGYVFLFLLKFSLTKKKQKKDYNLYIELDL